MWEFWWTCFSPTNFDFNLLVSFQPLYQPIFILIIRGEKMGEAWEPSNKELLFGVSVIIGHRWSEMWHLISRVGTPKDSRQRGNLVFTGRNSIPGHFCLWRWDQFAVVKPWETSSDAASHPGRTEASTLRPQKPKSCVLAYCCCHRSVNTLSWMEKSLIRYMLLSVLRV